jgi:hypothetical protein
LVGLFAIIIFSVYQQVFCFLFWAAEFGRYSKAKGQAYNDQHNGIRLFVTGSALGGQRA